ncbi:cation transporter [soil metagenome]
MNTNTSNTILLVPGMTCGHCEAAVKSEVGKVAGVTDVSVDLATKLVTVTGVALDHAALVAAVDEAGFEVG